ncbi:MAG: methyltransferase domain-containing protein [candidate division Zixibacteria bacterium]|nr:methyltransferase domain-containing protein [candidate division Zixibacteria bacterium]
MSGDESKIDWSDKCWKEMLIYQRKSMWLEDTLDKVAAWLGLKPGMTALDVGCGLGYLGHTFWPYFGKGSQYFGVDANPELLKDAEEAAKEWAKEGEARFVQAHAYSIPLDDDLADLVMCQGLLMHLEKPEKALAEMIRVARPGGLITCIEPDSLSALLEQWYWSLPELTTEEKLLFKKVALMSNEGSIKLGQGDGSIGNKVPFMMSKLGLVDIRIRQNDAVCYIEPPYEGPRQKDLLDNVKKQWLDEDRRKAWTDRQRRHFLAGGGDSAEYDRYLQVQERNMQAFRQQIKDGQYSVCGSGHIYVIKGRKPKQA